MAVETSANSSGGGAPEPRLALFLERRASLWGSELVVLVAILIDVALPQRLTPFGPTWLLPSLEGLLLLGLMAITPHRRLRHSRLRRRAALGLTALVSAANLISLGLLCHYLLTPAHQHPISNGQALIGAGAALWLTSVLLFGLWYWEVDRGGPLSRYIDETRRPDFLFPQMSDPRWSDEQWRPGLIDYLYVSLTNACAFSPTDTMPLTAMAKTLMGAQAVASLVTVGLVVARAVNILS